MTKYNTIEILMVAGIIFIAAAIGGFIPTPFSTVGVGSAGEATLEVSTAPCGWDNAGTLFVQGVSTVPTLTGAETFAVVGAVGTTSGAFLFGNGEGTTDAALQTSALAATYSAFGVVLTCDDSYYLIAGNDTAAALKALAQTYYLAELDSFTMDGNEASVLIDLVPLGNVTLMGRTTTATPNWNATTAHTGTLAASTSYTGWEVRISETARGVINQPHMAVGWTGASALATEFQFFYPKGSTEATIPNRLAAAYNKAYKLKEETINADDVLIVPLTAVTTAGYTSPAAQSATILIYDMGTYIYKGHVVEAAENLANVNIGGEDSAAFNFLVN